MSIAESYEPGSWMNFYSNPKLPDDPGGPLTWEREDILRRRAEGRLDYGMLDVLTALEKERDARREAEHEVAMLFRCVREGTAWLVAEVEATRATAIQADRALALCAKNTGCIPPVACSPRRWFTHAQHPDPDDLGHADAFYNVARRVLYQVTR